MNIMKWLKEFLCRHKNLSEDWFVQQVRIGVQIVVRRRLRV